MSRKREVTDCERVKHLLAARKQDDGDGILHPTWLETAPKSDTLAALRGLGFKPEYGDRRKSPTPFRRYFDRKGRRTLIVEPWTFECLGRCPEIADTKPKRMRQYAKELDRRLAGDVDNPADAIIAGGEAANVLCGAWWDRGPKVRVRVSGPQPFGQWDWEATSFVIVEGIHPTPIVRGRNPWRTTVWRAPMPFKAGNRSPLSSMKRRLIR